MDNTGRTHGWMRHFIVAAQYHEHCFRWTGYPRSRQRLSARKKGLLRRGVVEGFFFDEVIVSAGLATETPDIVQGLIAIPASAFRLQCGDGFRLDHVGPHAGFSMFVSMVCITHDSAAQKIPCHIYVLRQAAKASAAGSLSKEYCKKYRHNRRCIGKRFEKFLTRATAALTRGRT